MAIPYSNRVAIASFPELALQSKPRVTPTEVWADFSNQAAPLLNFFECIQLISASKLRILFPTAALMEDCLSEGLTFRSHPLTLTPISSKKWVSVQCLPYGIPLEEVKRVLNPFGKIFHAKHEYMEGVTTGTISVQMEVKANIPSKVQIKGHSCLIFYNGQQRTCFICQAPDHITKNCPRRKGQQTAPNNDPASLPSTSTEQETDPPTLHPRSEESTQSDQANPPVDQHCVSEHKPGTESQEQEAPIKDSNNRSPRSWSPAHLMTLLQKPTRLCQQPTVVVHPLRKLLTCPQHPTLPALPRVRNPPYQVLNSPCQLPPQPQAILSRPSHRPNPILPTCPTLVQHMVPLVSFLPSW